MGTLGDTPGGAQTRSKTHGHQGMPSYLLSVSGFVLLATTKAFDILTTVVGLGRSSRLVETNAFARRVMASWGPTEGLILLGGLLVLATTVVIEWAAIQIGRQSPPLVSPSLVRGVGYGSLSSVYLAAAYRNTRLIVETSSIELVIPLLV